MKIGYTLPTAQRYTLQVVAEFKPFGPGVVSKVPQVVPKLAKSCLKHFGFISLWIMDQKGPNMALLNQ